MLYKMHKNGSYNIHTIKTDRFKNVRMEIVFHNNIDPENIAKRSILFEMLLESSKNYPTKRELTLQLESLYNAICYGSTSKAGNQIITSICMDFLNPKYTKEDYLESALSLPFDLIFNPNIINNEFNNDTLTTVKNRMICDLKVAKENPQRTAIEEALKTMDEKSVSSVNIYGSIDEINEVTSSNLINEYYNILGHDYIDIFIIGDIDMDKAIDIINKYASFKTIKTHELKLYVENKKRNRVIHKKCSSVFSQSQIVYILNTVNLTEEEMKYAFIIYNMILGGGSQETKLFNNLRDKNSLCYGVNSLYQKYDNLLLIHTAVDKKNIDKATKLINKSLKEMISSVAEEEVNYATSAIINALNMVLDQPAKIIDQYLFNYIALLDPIDKRIEMYRHIKAQDIMNVAKKVKLNTIYILEGDKNGEN